MPVRGRGAGYANRNQGIDHPAAAGAAAGAGYANRNQGIDHPAAAGAAAGAGYANRNQGIDHPAAAGAAAGAGYANHNQYDQYHPGMGYGQLRTLRLCRGHGAGYGGWLWRLWLRQWRRSMGHGLTDVRLGLLEL